MSGWQLSEKWGWQMSQKGGWQMSQNRGWQMSGWHMYHIRLWMLEEYYSSSMVCLWIDTHVCTHTQIHQNQVYSAVLESKYQE